MHVDEAPICFRLTEHAQDVCSHLPLLQTLRTGAANLQVSPPRLSSPTLSWCVQKDIYSRSDPRS